MRFLFAMSLVNLTSADVGMCTKPDGSKAPCGFGNQECSQFGFGLDTPQFHVRDNSCGLNDPNGPVFDPVHGVYHLHYQNHVGLQHPDGSGGRTYGHAVSRDFVHWAHMPISIWNDRTYDASHIFTGSATVVDGQVVQVYPGLCDTSNSSCPGGTNLCIAVPADSSDPLQTNWTKDEFAQNPVVPAIGRDPSTAWETVDGEWHLTTFDTMVFGSLDFKTWYRIGLQLGFIVGECPSFFEVPRTTPGAGPEPKGVVTSTHVHKNSHNGLDWMTMGTYVEGKIGELGAFTATAAQQLIDADALYASKDFYDPVKKRRINWGWAQVPPDSTMTMPREVTWHPELQQLVFSPLEEQDSLRGAVIGSVPTQTLTQGKEASLGIQGTKGNQSEVVVSFERPSAATRLAVTVMTSPSSTLPEPYAREMPNWDMSGGDYNVSNVNYTDFKTCEAACDADARCGAWTYVVRGPLYASCCLKTQWGSASQKASCTSGVKKPGQLASGSVFYVDYVPPQDGSSVSTVTVGGPSKTDKLKLLASDKSIDIRLYVDNTFTEAYWMGGRVAMTAKTPQSQKDVAGVTVSADQEGVKLLAAQAWEVGSIWVTPDEVKNTPRRDSTFVA